MTSYRIKVSFLFSKSTFKAHSQISVHPEGSQSPSSVVNKPVCIPLVCVGTPDAREPNEYD